MRKYSVCKAPVNHARGPLGSQPHISSNRQHVEWDTFYFNMHPLQSKRHQAAVVHGQQAHLRSSRFMTGYSSGTCELKAEVLGGYDLSAWRRTYKLPPVDFPF